MNIPVQIPSRSQNLSAILSIPKTNYVDNPLVIMCYGLNGDRADIHRIAYNASIEFCEQGIACLRFDYRGQGVSDGDFIDTSMRSKVEDILNVINFIKGCYYNETCKIILLGFSDGAKIVSLVACKSSDVYGVLLWNPIFHELKDGVDHAKVKRLAKVAGTNKLAMPFLGLWLGVEHLQDIKTVKSVHKLNDFDGYKIIITGSDDPYTEYIREYHLSINQKNLLYDIVQGANHTFSSLQSSNQLISLTIRHVKNLIDRGVYK